MFETIKAAPQGSALPDWLTPEAVRPVLDFHRAMPEYEPTPLVSLASLAYELGLGGIYVKDESKRFGLNAFKGLGGSYAIDVLLRRDNIEGVATFVTATDGNHGRGVAWAAQRAGHRAVVFMPQGSQAVRADAIRAFDADVTITDMNYDDTVRHAARYAAEHGCYLVQDTAFDDYTDIPALITQGYTTMAHEALEQLRAFCVDVPTHVFLQAGVGSMAGGLLGYLAHRLNGAPITGIVEPQEAACHFLSAQAGVPVAVGGHPHTIMAGLNCGEVNPTTWPILRDHAQWFIRCDDDVTTMGMRTLAYPLEGDASIVSGESGAAGLGALLALCEDDDARRDMALDERAHVLLFSTEGDTDPAEYRNIVARK